MHHFGLFQPGWAGVDIFFVFPDFDNPNTFVDQKFSALLCTLLRKASSQNPATVLLLDSVVLFCGIPNRSTKRITLLLRVQGLRLVSAHLSNW